MLASDNDIKTTSLYRGDRFPDNARLVADVGAAAKQRREQQTVIERQQGSLVQAAAGAAQDARHVTRSTGGGIGEYACSACVVD